MLICVLHTEHSGRAIPSFFPAGPSRAYGMWCPATFVGLYTCYYLQPLCSVPFGLDCDGMWFRCPRSVIFAMVGIGRGVFLGKAFVLGHHRAVSGTAAILGGKATA